MSTSCSRRVLGSVLSFGEKLKIGDMVQKIDGYGKEMGWLGLVIAFRTDEITGHTKVIVFHDGEIDQWMKLYVEKVEYQPVM